ncbi:g7458 [Coccomyxa viridis]|uniref:G7458 protein n=1 Tax=Coccomyxa viridis TaxID=1274662 RepID=A0ABP1FZ13_9CHLO
MDCIDSDASEAGPSCAPADADTAAAAAEPPRYIKGRLKAKLAFWKLFCTSTWVLSWISDGYQIPWNEWGPPPSHAYANQQGALRHQEFVSKEVADLLARGSIIQTDRPPLVVNPLNVVEHNGKLRLILDLVYVNYYIRKEGMKFRYEDIRQTSLYFKPDDHMFSVDLQKAYHHVDMHESTWDYLGFSWLGQTYTFTVMPFGLSPACWVFTKLTNELVGRWRALGIRVIHYIDDFLFAVAPDPDGKHSLFKSVQEQVLGDIEASGFSLSVPKLVLDPQKVIQFLGYVVDLGLNRLTVDPKRVVILKALLRQLLARPRRTHVKDLARVTGLLQSMNYAVGHSIRIFTRSLYDLMNQKPLHVWNWHVALDEGALYELRFWQNNFDRLHGAPLWLDPHVQTVLFTDAGAHGWGGFLVEHGRGQTLRVPSSLEEYFAAGGSEVAQGYLDPVEQAQSSTWRELIAIERTLWSLLRDVSLTVVRLFTDNLAVHYVWLAGSRKKIIQDIVRRIFEFCHERSIQLWIEWVPRENNLLADALSKYHDRDDWMLNSKYFRILDKLWGPHTFDRFASATNKQCEQFNSRFWCPGSAGVNALAYDWSGENNWVNPPFGLMGKVLLHMKACKAIIVPRWPKREWWPLLRARSGTKWAPSVVGVRCLNTNRQADVFLPGPGSANTIVVGAPKWAVFALRVDFRNDA